MKTLAALTAVAMFMASTGMAVPATKTPPIIGFKDQGLLVSGDILTAEKAQVCLAARSSTNGSPVTADACDDSKDKWIFENGGIKLASTKDTHDLCLDVKDGCAADGTKLQAYKCHDGFQQQFTYDPDHQWFVWTSPDKKAYCVDLTNGAVKGQAQIWSCTENDPNQKWVSRASTTVKGTTTAAGAAKPTDSATAAPKEEAKGGDGAKEAQAAKEGQGAGQPAKGNFFEAVHNAIDGLAKKFSTPATGKK